MKKEINRINKDLNRIQSKTSEMGAILKQTNHFNKIVIPIFFFLTILYYLVIWTQ